MNTMGTNVLDNVIDATVTAVTTAAPSVTAPQTTSNDEVTMALNNGNYMRGLSQSVKAGDNIDAMLDRAGMNWRVVEMPVAIVGRRETRIDPDYKALVRSDNGVRLDITSQKYQPFQNRDVFGTFLHMAEVMGGEMVSTAVIDDGRYLSATVNLGKRCHIGNTSGMKLNDTVGLTAVISTGHKAGTAMRVKGSAIRLACLNGMTVHDDVVTSLLSVAHNHRWTSNETRRILELVNGYSDQFEKLMEKLNRLAETRIERDMYSAYFLELFNPETLADARKAAETVINTSNTGGVRNQLSVGRVVLDNILADTDTFFAGMGRTAKRVRDVVRTQPGHNLSAGTMWDAYNAVTYYVDHERGREQGAAVLSALMGDGDRLKTRALDLAVEYTQRIQGAVN